MELFAIDTYCPIYFTTHKMYCYRFSDGTIIPNGCDFAHHCQECKDCFKKSIATCESLIASGKRGLPLH